MSDDVRQAILGVLIVLLFGLGFGLKMGWLF